MKEFYPTPSALIYQLIEGLKVAGKSVLDPSAGKGNILSYISKHYNRYKNKLFAIEKSAELRAVLVDKGFAVVGTDFLEYPGLQYFDFIIMNPPFSNGATHLLKAWDIANGATIRCILNEETLRNPYTEERRRLAQIIEKYGWSKELGPVFTNAERKTSVEVMLVHLQDTRDKESFRLDYDPEVMSTADFDLGDIENNELALGNIFDNYEAGFRGAIEAFKELLVVRQKVGHYLAPLTSAYHSPASLIADSLTSGTGDTEAGSSYQNFLEKVTKAAWDHLFEKTKLGAVTTEGVRREIEKYQAGQGTMAFTASNMEDLFHTLLLNQEQVMLQCILEVFDDLTRHHKENREYVEGWKTNASYKVGKKFILPYIGSNWGSSGLDYQAERKIADIEKALCFLSGKRYASIWSVTQAYDRKSHFSEWRTSEFFDTKLFKKRTMHFRWLSPELRDEFNAVVARERWGELPEKTKAGAYK